MSATKIGQQFVRFASSTSAQAVFTPSTNVHGAYLRTVTVVGANPGSTTSIVIVADTAAPTSGGDTSKRSIFNAALNTGETVMFTLPYELEVPAGWGVWAIADSASWGVTITYDIVS